MIFYFESSNGLEYKVDVGIYTVWVWEKGAYKAGWLSYRKQLNSPLDWEQFNDTRDQPPEDVKRYCQKIVANLAFA